MKPTVQASFRPRLRHALGALFVALFSVVSLPTHAADSGAQAYKFGLTLLQGSGKLQTETRSVGSFSAVEVQGSMNVVLRPAAREAMTLQADDNLLVLVETRVVNRSGVPTLVIGLREHANFSSRNPITLTVDVVTLSSLSVRGSGKLSGDGIKAPALQIVVTGSGDVKLQKLSLDEASLKISGSGNADLSGKAGRLVLSISGSGDINTRALEADEVSVSIAGSGDASVNARKTLAVSIAGSGDVEYTGEATLKTAIAGSGHVKKR